MTIPQETIDRVDRIHDALDSGSLARLCSLCGGYIACSTWWLSGKQVCNNCVNGTRALEAYLDASEKEISLKPAEPKCACGASLVTTKEVGTTGRCGECFLGGDSVVSMALTRQPAFPDVSRPAVALSEQEHPRSWWSGRRGGRR